MASRISRCVRSALAVALVALGVIGGRAQAQPLDPQRIAVAEALVDQGRRLMAEGKLDEACRKFDEAVRTSESWATGALAQLAECHEKAGRLAGAWGTWVQAELAASRAGQKERADYARDRAAMLDRRLPRLTVVVPDSLRAQAGVDVARDGVSLAPEQWGLPIRVDPGRHTLRAAAPRRVAWEVELDVNVGEVRVLAPRQLEETPVTAAPRGPARPPDHGVVTDDTGKVQRRVGIVVGGAGVAALAAAGAFLVELATRNADYRTACAASGACTRDDSDPYGLRAAASSSRSASIAFGLVGAAALGSGIAIYVTSPRRGPTAAAPYGPVAAVLGPGAVTVRGQW